MPSIASILSATVLFAQSTVAFNCSIKPIYVDIHKRVVHESTAFQYGSFIGVGTAPAQNHSLWPSLSQNHMSFGALKYCENSKLANCTASTGGFYDSNRSTTFVEYQDFKSLDADVNNTLKGYFGQDVLRLYTHFYETDGASQTLVPNSTIEAATGGDIIPGRVGMGPSSTLLQDLAGQETIAGKTYSLYIGQGFDRAGGKVNGSNVFGGYDSGRFTGEPHQYPMNLNNVNAMSVRIKDIVLTQTAGGANQSLFDPKDFPDMKSTPQTFEAEITTEQFPLSLPYQITQNFIKAVTGQKDNHWGDNSLKAASSLNATLSIILEDGFTVTFPPEVLRNYSDITPIQDREETSNAPFLLGSAFLGQVYLMADYDSSNFFLAPAVQKNNMVMPVTFCPKTTPAAYERPKQSAWQSQGLIGAVLGGVIGGLGCLAALYCLYISWLRKSDERRLKRDLARNQASKLEQMDIESAPSFDGPPKSGAKQKVLFWKKG
ncbi:aspartic peptidase domain-containing protein [Boeremia exigua]|uniref:aspartic peptidase domain-containing protein n=1 Tax=Boeremia exigua TaxID=749465 RepID=UPI001E8D5B31|nr:aspartic peptidase domain-containing protein [Boeremia exigua]KAH6638951.1 aspartic peptidase domain-containing protein [Boeremia exigua]